MCSSTSTKRSDHQVWPITPRVLRAFSPPSTGRGRAGGGYQLLLTGLADLAGLAGLAGLADLADRILRQLEDVAQILA